MSNEETPAGTTGGSIDASSNPLGELPPRVRVHALAKLLGSSSRDVLAKLTELGETARSAQSSVPREVAIKVAEALTPTEGESAPAATEGAAPAPAEAPRAVEPAAAGPVVADPTEPATAPEATIASETPASTSGAPSPGTEKPATQPVSDGGAAASAGNAGDQPAAGSTRRPARSTRRRATRPASSPFAAAPEAAPEPADTQEPVATPEPEPEPERPLAHVPVFAAPSPVFLPPESTAARTEEPPAPAAQVREEEPEAREKAETAQDTDDTDDTSGGRRRRRRGRRGRGRGKGGDEGSSEETGEEQDQADDDKSEEETKPEGEDSSDDSDEAEGANRRRRRRRRRKGSEDDSAETGGDDPANTVVHVREAKSESDKNGKNGQGDGVRSVRGSTRLEAKRQRRRDGREAGRRRAPILSEAEFLARREAVARTMVVAERGENTQIGVLEDGVLVEHFVTSQGSGSIVGNVYLGRVQNVLPSMEAAFVDIGRGRNAVLYAGEVDWDAAGLEGKSRKIEQALSTGDNVLVQVTKDPVGHKGARLTTQISLPGRFLVYVPAGGATGISRKLPENERRRLKDILKRIVPEDAGVIIRTASEGISEEELERDVRRLKAQWEVIKEKADSAGGSSKKSAAPTMLYEEPDLLVKVVRDLFTEDFAKLEVQGGTAWETINSYVRHVAPDLTDRLKRYVGNDDVFSVYRIDEQITKALDRKVWLPSGGYLVIDRTEAMTVIDVNTGKFTGSGGNLEETVTRNNLESAEEIVRQLRLRDIGGIIVIDFIDMVLESNRELVLRRLTECLGRDRTRHQVAEVTSLGLVQMTRKKVGTGLIEAFSTTCEHCKGRGVVVSTEQPQPSNGTNGGGQGSRRSRGRGKGEDQSQTEARSEQGGPTPEQRESVVSAVQAIANAAKVASGGKAEETDDAEETPATSTAQEAGGEVKAGASKRAGRGKARRAGKAPGRETAPAADSGSPEQALRSEEAAPANVPSTDGDGLEQASGAGKATGSEEERGHGKAGAEPGAASVVTSALNGHAPEPTKAPEAGPRAASEFAQQAEPREPEAAAGHTPGEATTAGGATATGEGQAPAESGKLEAGSSTSGTESEDVSVPQPAVRAARRRPRRAASRPAGPPVHASDQS